MLPVDLPLAAGRNQLRLAFVPLVCTRTGAVAGFAAHPCWEHPGVGRVSPRRVRPVAERIGYTRRLDAWALERLGTSLADWDAGALGALRLLALVVGPETLADARAQRHLRALCDLAFVPPRRLCLVADPGDFRSLLRAKGLRTTAAGSVSESFARQLLGRARPVTLRVRAFARIDAPA